MPEPPGRDEDGRPAEIRARRKESSERAGFPPRVVDFSVTVTKDMKDKGIDLALPAGGYGGDPISTASDRPPDYPTLHLEFTGDDAVDFPKDGKVEFEYHLASETESDRGGKKRCSYTLEIRKLLDVEGEKDIRPSKSDTSASDALDKLMKQKESESDDDGDEDY